MSKKSKQIEDTEKEINTIFETDALEEVQTLNENVKDTKKKKGKVQEIKTEPLKISEKRRMTYNIMRTFQKNEMLVNKIIKYFITNNFLLDPIKQGLDFDLQINREKNEAIMSIAFNTNLAINQGMMTQAVKEYLKDMNMKIINNITSTESMVSMNFVQKMDKARY